VSAAAGSAVDIRVRVTPRAGRDEVVGVDADGALRIRVAAAPVDGEANRVLVRTLAKQLGVPPSALQIVAGAAGRTKRLRIHGIDAGTLRSRWPGLEPLGAGAAEPG
jgi:uncharacterized protein (TIGR00251 family)